MKQFLILLVFLFGITSSLCAKIKKEDLDDNDDYKFEDDDDDDNKLVFKKKDSFKIASNGLKLANVLSNNKVESIPELDDDEDDDVKPKHYKTKKYKTYSATKTVISNSPSSKKLFSSTPVTTKNMATKYSTIGKTLKSTVISNIVQTTQINKIHLSTIPINNMSNEKTTINFKTTEYDLDTNNNSDLTTVISETQQSKNVSKYHYCGIYNNDPITKYSDWTIVLNDTYRNALSIETIQSIANSCDENTTACVGAYTDDYNLNGIHLIACANCKRIFTISEPNLWNLWKSDYMCDAYWYNTYWLKNQEKRLIYSFGFSNTAERGSWYDSHDLNNNKKLNWWLRGGGFRAGKFRVGSKNFDISNENVTELLTDSWYKIVYVNL